MEQLISLIKDVHIFLLRLLTNFNVTTSKLLFHFMCAALRSADKRSPQNTYSII